MPTADSIHSVNDLMNAAANALAERDIETLEQLARIPDNWMQDEQSADAQRAMLISMMEACHTLADLE